MLSSRPRQQLRQHAIGADKHSGDLSVTLLLKLILKVAIGVAGCFHVKDYSEHEYSSPRKD